MAFEEVAPTVNKKGGYGSKRRLRSLSGWTVLDKLIRLSGSGKKILLEIIFLLLLLVLKKDIESTYGHRSLILQLMSGKMCSSNSVVQAQKLVDQLRVEAGMERLKVRKKNYVYSSGTLTHI